MRTLAVLRTRLLTRLHATSADTCPRRRQVRFLNINRKISALACGKLSPKMGREVLLVGAQTTLLAYDVQENSDLFFKDAPDVRTLRLEPTARRANDARRRSSGASGGRAATHSRSGPWCRTLSASED